MCNSILLLHNRHFITIDNVSDIDSSVSMGAFVLVLGQIFEAYNALLLDAYLCIWIPFAMECIQSPDGDS